MLTVLAHPGFKNTAYVMVLTPSEWSKTNDYPTGRRRLNEM